MQMRIRNEEPRDYRAVEILHRNAFWNVNAPGCDEHYLAHVLREHRDFVPELDLVVEKDGAVIANIMYTKSKLRTECGETQEILTFGPVGVAPEYQRQGIGKALLAKSFVRAAAMGCKAIVIFGNPENYVSSGFKSCKKYHVCLEGGVFPTALLVKELEPGFFDGTRYYFQESDAFSIEGDAAERFDREFEKKERGYCPSQEEFYILSHSVIRDDPE